jgi:hypothetical protein
MGSFHSHKSLYTCDYCYDFRCDFCLLIDVNEWMSYGCWDESIYTYTPNIHNSSILVYIHQKKKIALKFAAKIASVNEPIYRHGPSSARVHSSLAYEQAFIQTRPTWMNACSQANSSYETLLSRGFQSSIEQIAEKLSYFFVLRT